MTFTAKVEVEQEFLSILYLVPGIRYYGDLLQIQAQSYRRNYNAAGTQTGTTKFATEGFGPVQSSDYSFPLGVLDLTDGWELPGFDTVTLTGAIQLAH